MSFLTPKISLADPARNLIERLVETPAIVSACGAHSQQVHVQLGCPMPPGILFGEVWFDYTFKLLQYHHFSSPVVGCFHLHVRLIAVADTILHAIHEVGG